MRYKGMVAKFEYINSMGHYIGEIINCPDVVSFSARTLSELQALMEESVETYLQYRKQKLQALSHSQVS